MNDQQNQQEALALRSYLRPIWRRKWIVLLVAIVACGGTYFLTSREQNTYVATTQVYVQNADPITGLGTGTLSGPPSPQQLQDIATLFTAQPVTASVYERLRRPLGSAGSITATPDTGSSFLTVTATGHSPGLVARLANTYVSAFLAERHNEVVQQASAERINAQAALATLRGRPNDPTASAQRQTLVAQIAQLQSVEDSPTSGAQQINPAMAPSAPVSPTPKRDAAFGLAIGLTVGILLALGLDLLDNRLIRIDTIEEIFKRPVLTVLPHIGEPSPTLDGHPAMPAAFVEPMRTLRVSLRLASGGESPRTIVVTSSLAREGKSTIVRSLALTFAEAGNRVLVIDADLRRPTQELAFGVDGGVGLAQVLQGDMPLAEATKTVAQTTVGSTGTANGAARDGSNGSSNGRVDVLVHGARVEDPVSVLSSAAMRELVADARAAYDVVLLDTPPLIAVSDAIPLLGLVDLSLVVVRMGEVKRGSAQRASEILERVPGLQVTGLVVNDMRRAFSGTEFGSYGSYGYSYRGERPKRDVSV